MEYETGTKIQGETQTGEGLDQTPPKEKYLTINGVENGYVITSNHNCVHVAQSTEEVLKIVKDYLNHEN